MFFLIEAEGEKLSLDNQILLSLIQEEAFPIEFKDAIPLGTIEFSEPLGTEVPSILKISN